MAMSVSAREADAVNRARANTAVSIEEIAGRLAVAVGRINRRIRPAGDGLSHGLLSALSTIVRTGPLRPGDLARTEVVAAPSMTRAIADLESRSLVTRSPDPADGRSFFLTATDAGVEAVLRARSERAERVAALLAERTDDELASLAAALDALDATAASPAAPVIPPSPGAGESGKGESGNDVGAGGAPPAG